jgi:hypothetical protein
MDSSTPLTPAASALGISFDGRAFHYQQYSYDRLPDALDYAVREHARPGVHAQPVAHLWRQWTGPTPQERTQMAALGISHERGYYYYGPYRYDLLASALDYARAEPGLQRQRQVQAEGSDAAGSAR